MSMPAARLSNANVYERLGIRTIVNASGPSTRLSGGIMRPEVAAAMAEASQWCVDLAEVQGRASEILAEATGAEAGYVTAGASAALMLASAACLAGFDPAKMNRLPDTTGMANEVVVARSQRNMYDRAVAQAGARLVEVGIPDRFSGAGVRDAQSWEYEAAINDKTAAILWVAQDHSEPSLPEIVTLARRHKLPVIVDAAGQLPPAENLKRFVAEGADLVAFSGGKAIGGPQASGFLAGGAARAAPNTKGPGDDSYRVVGMNAKTRRKHHSDELSLSERPRRTPGSRGTCSRRQTAVRAAMGLVALLLAHFRRNFRWSWPPPWPRRWRCRPRNFAGQGASHVTPTGR